MYPGLKYRKHSNNKYTCIYIYTSNLKEVNWVVYKTIIDQRPIVIICIEFLVMLLNKLFQNKRKKKNSIKTRNSLVNFRSFQKQLI